MIKKKILFADNIPDFLLTRAEFLAKAGYQVLKAFTIDETQRLLAEAHVHLAILDIRMVNDDDEKDISGLLLAREPAYRSIPKIILTGKPSVSGVKEALDPMMGSLPPAVDFVVKDDGPQVMIQAVEKVFNQFVRINWELSFQWDQREPLSFPYLVSLLESDLPNDILIYRSDELEDLIRKLFYQYQKIRFGRLLWHDRSQFCLPVIAQSLEQATDLHILICGEREIMERERSQIKKMAPNTVHGTSLLGQTETTHFSANLLGLTGAGIETVQTMRDLLRVGKERPLKAAFSHLLSNVLNEWHRHGQMMREENDLMSIYRECAGLTNNGVSRSQLDQQIDALIRSIRALGIVEIERKNQQIIIQFPHQSPNNFPDPLSVVYSQLPQYTAPVICRISPGQLSAENILVDSEQKTWLTDFGCAGQLPQWWDFICLEASVRFNSSQAPDFLAWLEFEDCLTRSNSLDEHLEQNDVVPELRMSVALIEQIRQQASNETGSNPTPYYAGLLVWIVEAISHFDSSILSTQPETLRNAHLLLAASMLAERLGMMTNNSIPVGGQLHIDENDKVWIGDHYIVTFSGLRLKLFRCLYEQVGKPVNTREIVERVYGEKYDALDRDQNQRIRQEISRIRDAIEPKPNRPRYILTVREKGYLLQANGEPEK